MIMSYLANLKMSGFFKIFSWEEKLSERPRHYQREKGEAGIIHKSRRRPSSRAYSKNFKENVLKLYEDNYMGFGPLLASEKLEEVSDIKISDETLRNWLIEAGHWEISRKRATTL